MQGDVGLGGLQGKMELLGVEFFRTAPEVLLHESLHLGLHLPELEREDAALFFGSLPLRPDHRLQLGGVVGEVGAHVSMHVIQ